MRVSGRNFVDASHALIVGIGDYNGSFPDLPECPRIAKRIADILQSPSGCGLPPENVKLLSSPTETTLANITASLESLVSATGAEGTLLFYFAGHGFETSNVFALACSDSLGADDVAHALRAVELARILSLSPYRGLVIVLDCCGGAGFIETAPEIFDRLADIRDFKVVLSATRRGQSNWEIEGRGSNFSLSFVEALMGKLVGLGPKGEIFLGPLAKHLAHSATEANERASGHLPPSEPVFYFVGQRSPLLFLNSCAAIASLRVKPRRYSKRTLQLRLVGAAIATTVIINSAALTLRLVMERSKFYKIDDRGELTMQQGLPWIAGFGFPRLIWEMEEFSPEHFRQESSIRTVGTLIWPSSKASTALLNELTEDGRKHFTSLLAAPPASETRNAPSDYVNEFERKRATLVYSALKRLGIISRDGGLAGGNEISREGIPKLGQIGCTAPPAQVESISGFLPMALAATQLKQCKDSVVLLNPVSSREAELKIWSEYKLLSIISLRPSQEADLTLRLLAAEIVPRLGDVFMGWTVAMPGDAPDSQAFVSLFGPSTATEPRLREMQLDLDSPAALFKVPGLRTLLHFDRIAGINALRLLMGDLPFFDVPQLLGEFVSSKTEQVEICAAWSSKMTGADAPILCDVMFGPLEKVVGRLKASRSLHRRIATLPLGYRDDLDRISDVLPNTGDPSEAVLRRRIDLISRQRTAVLKHLASLPDYVLQEFRPTAQVTSWGTDVAVRRYIRERTGDVTMGK